MDTRNRHKNKNEAGVTLIELVITILILGIISLFGYGIIALNARTFNTVKDNTVNHWDLRTAMRIVQNDLRMLRPGGVINGTLPANHIDYHAADGHTYRYRLNGGNLQRRVDGGNWNTILSNITANPFSYEDVDHVNTVDKTKLVYIGITLKTIVNGKTSTMSEKIYVRN